MTVMPSSTEHTRVTVFDMYRYRAATELLRKCIKACNNQNPLVIDPWRI